MHSICPIESKPNPLSRQENYVNEKDLKNINFDNIVKLNISGANNHKKNSNYNNITQLENIVPLLKKRINLPLRYDLLDEAFERFYHSSLIYKNNKLENVYQLAQSLNTKFAKNSRYKTASTTNINISIYPKNADETNSLPQCKSIIILYLVLGKKRKPLQEVIQEPIDNAFQDDYQLSIKNFSQNDNKDEEIVDNATENSSNNEPSSMSMKCLHKIKKKLLKIKSKYQTSHYLNQKELLFSIGNYFYSVTIARESRKITLLKKTELHKKENQYSSDKEILLELQKVLKGLQYLINKQKGIK